MSERFISVIAKPGYLYSPGLVIDTHRQCVVAECSERSDADLVAVPLNKHWDDRREAVALIPEEVVK